MSYSVCANCGDPKFQEKRKDFQCAACGYKKVDFKELEEASIWYCEGCGCNFINGCTQHPAGMQKKSKL